MLDCIGQFSGPFRKPEVFPEFLRSEDGVVFEEREYVIVFSCHRCLIIAISFEILRVLASPSCHKLRFLAQLYEIQRILASES